MVRERLEILDPGTSAREAARISAVFRSSVARMARSPSRGTDARLLPAPAAARPALGTFGLIDIDRAYRKRGGRRVAIPAEVDLVRKLVGVGSRVDGKCRASCSPTVSMPWTRPRVKSPLRMCSDTAAATCSQNSWPTLA